MGATYTRQSSSAIVDGAVIEAADINAEFDQILAAFAVTSGHTHDGTAAEGGPITKLLGTSITIGDGTAGTDIAVTFDGETGDGVLTWMEDEDYFQFSDDLLLTTTEKLQFRDTAIYINSSADGQLDLVADTEIQIAATTIDINGAVALNGAITGATNITLSGELDAATLDISGNADIDGTLEADAITINGTAIGSIYGAVAGSSSIVTTGALDSGSITSGFGTIDTGSSTITTTGLITGGSLDIDNVLIDGTTIGHTNDTDLMTLADGVLTVAGEVDAVSLDISGDADIDGTLEADAITVNGATLTEFITDAVGGMVSSNTETGITVTFEDGDNTLDFALGSSQTTISSLTNTSLVIGRDADNDIDFATDNTILFRADGADQIKLVNGALAPVTDDDIDLGTASLEFKDGFFDGTVTADAFAGPLTGNVTGNVSGTAATVTTAAQSNITSLGTLTTLTVDNVIINGTTIGHTDDTDLITLADGIATVAGEVSLTTLDIGGTNVTATAAELNLLDGDTSVGGSITLADADGVVTNDGGTMKTIPASDIKTYVGAATGAFSIANLDIDGGTDIGEAIVDADLFIIDNGAGGTNRKVAASRLITYVDANSSAASVGKAIAMAIVFG